MHPWIESYFGSLEAVTAQHIIKLTNIVTWEGALYNDLRARRPLEARDHNNVRQIVQSNGSGPFGQPLEATPEDVFGRIKGRHSVTASNIAKYDGFHGIVIFGDQNPLYLDREAVKDYFQTALSWAERAHETDPSARYFFFMWNCLWKSGASITHGHAQMTLTRDMHYAKVEALRRAALAYRRQYGDNYFDDLYGIHHDLGLVFVDGNVRGFAYLTPIKEKEVMLMANGVNDDLMEQIFLVLNHFTQELNVLSFNLALYLPPLEAPEGEDWRGFPVLVRIVDRGDLGSRVADFGGMELYAQSVIGTDPFFIARSLRQNGN
jgi:galactose-1-phosphate uridylyltransferase